MKTVYTFLALLFYLGVYAQENTKLSTLEFVQILNNNKEEAHYYYLNNWKKLREMAMEKNYIDSYQLLETTNKSDAPYHLILITTYKNNIQFTKSEDRFNEIINSLDGLKLLNNIEPKDFRLIISSQERVKHLE